MEELESLISRAQAGDLDAYGRIVQQFQDMAVGYAYSILGDFHLAEDAVQEAFIEAYPILPRVYGPHCVSGLVPQDYFQTLQSFDTREAR